MIKDAIEDSDCIERTQSSLDLYLDGWKGGVMTVEEYRIELLRQAEEFVDYWISQKDKDMFPESMDEGEWDEQFRVFTVFGGE